MDNIAINQILLLLLQCIIVGSLLLSLFKLRSIFGLGLVYITLGVFQYLQVFLANAIFFEIAPGIYASPGSMVLFTASLFAVLIVYIREDALETRKIIYAIIAINIILSFLQLIFSWSIEGESVHNIYNLPKEFFIKNVRIIMGGTLALALDAFLIIYFYEKISKYFKTLFLRVFLSMAIILIIDSLLFSFVGYIGTPQFLSVLLSSIISKLFASIIYSILFTIYLIYFEKDYFSTETSESTYNDVFNALTFRQKYERVFEEKEITKKKFQKSEITTQSILQAIDDFVFVLDKHNRFTAYYANPDGLYLKAKDFLGKTIAETMPAHTNQLFEEVLPLVKKGKTADIEYDLEMPQGKSWYSIKLSPIIEKNEYNGLAAVSRDITERKKASETISQSNERLTDTLESMSDGFVSLDKNWIYTYVNKNAAEMFGRKAEELVGKHIWTEFPDGVDQPFYKTYYKVVETKKQINFEEYYEPWNRWFKNSVIPTKDGLSIFFQEITDRKLAEIELQNSKNYIQTVFDSTSDAIFILDEETGVILDVNRQMTEMYGFEKEEVLNGTVELVSMVESPYSEKEALEWLRKSKAEGKQTFEWQARHKKGHMFWVEVSLVFVLIAEQERCIASIRNIEERKLAEIALRDSQAFNKTLLDTTPDLIYIYDIIEKKNIYSNTGITKMLGYSIEEIQGFGENLLPELMHPDDFNRYLKEILPRYQTVKDEEIIDHEYRLKHKEGKWRWLNSKETIFMRLADGKPKQIFGLTSDVTERKKYTEEINQLNINLEQKVKERTLKLEKQNKTLEKMNTVFVGRELRMAELKKEIKKLKNE